MRPGSEFSDDADLVAAKRGEDCQREILSNEVTLPHDQTDREQRKARELRQREQRPHGPATGRVLESVSRVGARAFLPQKRTCNRDCQPGAVILESGRARNGERHDVRSPDPEREGLQRRAQRRRQ